MPNITTLLRSNPTSTVRRFQNVRASRPAPTSRTSDSAICATTRTCRPDHARRRSRMPMPLSFNAGVTFTRVALSAGTSPNNATVERATPNVYAD